jgi:hypothetical protein
MRTTMRLSFCLLALILQIASPASAGTRAPENETGDCLSMTVAASDIASFGGQARQHFRIAFENHCDAVRVIYWCAEHPSVTVSSGSVCAGRASVATGFAAPLYSVSRRREFQWTFPQGTRIRYVDCDASTYPTSDFRCRAPTQRSR